MNYQTQIPSNVLPATWIGRVIAALIAASIAVVGLFFFAFALLAAALIAAIVAARIWWISRKLRARRDQDVIEGSYSVEPEQTQAIQAKYIDEDVLQSPRK